MLPRAVLLDLDDTILDDSGDVEDCWRDACMACADALLADAAPAAVVAAIERSRDWYWSDAERHRIGRLALPAARRDIVRLAFVELGIDRQSLADRIADTYTLERDRRMTVLPGAVETVRWMRESGCRLALLTNGSAAGQRAKIARFELQPLFDLILIEGELGFGKPDPRVFDRALSELAVAAADAWMIGDHLEWDMAQAQRMGIYTVWVDFRGRGLPAGSTIRPDRIVHSLGELRSDS
jgi:putative hydrolase of the HAD superfamily